MAKLGKGRFTARIRQDVSLGGTSIVVAQDIPVLELDEIERLRAELHRQWRRGSTPDHPDWVRKRCDRLGTLIRHKRRALRHKQRQRARR